VSRQAWARAKVAAARAMGSVDGAEHRTALEGFVAALAEGDLEALVALLRSDAQIITDGGAGGRRQGRLHNLHAPLRGARKVAAFVLATAKKVPLRAAPRALNGRPGLVFLRGTRVYAALQLAVADGQIAGVYFHADATRLGHV
jgi:RNA polymerase sigma-70 factor (ECF subfamily)